MSFSLSKESKQFLIKTAIGAIESKFAKRRINIKSDEIPEELNFSSGCFVTLNKSGKLRGCIGNFRNDKNIVENVAEMALQAAFNDLRFPPLTEDEMQFVSVEISVLSPMVEIESIDEIKIGRHGIYIQKGASSGVLLPQVAVEHEWNVEQFLQHTCLKAGLNSDAYKKTGTKIYKFEGLVFSQDEC